MFHVDLLSTFGEKVLKFLVVKPTWMPNHVTYGIENLDSTHDLVEDHVCEAFLFIGKGSFFYPIWLTHHVTYDVVISTLYAAVLFDDIWKILLRSDKRFQ